MNGKKARNLRKLTRQAIPNRPLVAYKQTNKRDKLVPVATNIDGTTRYDTYESYTVELDNCQRAVYQRAKALHHAYYGR